ncbi:hypothetical protein ADL00_40580 [Streptomyces sp. AS58]|nr:hypothetical protein ADL00_40580 [Streptomyces sp. AS58]
MSQDFAAISGATMAALLILVLTELQATSSEAHERSARLRTEYAAAIRASFDEFYSGTPMPADHKRRVERDLNRWQTRLISSVMGRFWRQAYGLAAVTLVAGLVVVLRWSALAHQPKGYHSASAVLLAIGYSSAALMLGLYARYKHRDLTRHHEQLIALSALLDVPDAQNAASMYRVWWHSVAGAPGPQFRPFSGATIRYLKRHHGRSMR